MTKDGNVTKENADFGTHHAHNVHTTSSAVGGGGRFSVCYKSILMDLPLNY